MAKERLQNKVACGGGTFPVISIFIVFVWLMNAFYALPESNNHLGSFLGWYPSNLTRFVLGFVATGLCVYLLAELNNANALLRIRSRFITSTFVAFMAMSTFLHPIQSSHIILICIIAAYHILLHAYQNHSSAGYAFHTFLFLSFASLFYTPILFLAPFFFFSLAVYIKGLSPKSFFASIIGLLLPYWCWVVYLLHTNNIQDFTRPFRKAIQPPMFDYSMISTGQIVCVSIIALLSVIAIVHTVRNEFQDKIRVRSFYHFFMLMQLLYIVGMILYPEHFNKWYTLFLMNSSLFVAHFFALSSSRISNWLFIVSTLVILTLSIANIWLP